MSEWVVVTVGIGGGYEFGLGGWVYVWVDGWIDGWVDRCELVDEQTDRRIKHMT